MSDHTEQRAIETDGSETGAGAVPAKPAGQAPAGHYGRRALMFGAAAAGAGVAASVVGGGIAEAAPDSSAVQLGKSNTTSGTTIINSTTATGIQGTTKKLGQAGVTGIDNTPTSGNPHSNGVYGRSINGSGVLGISDHHNGVTGQASTSGYSGVAGIDLAPDRLGHGVYGQSNNGHGVYGYSYTGSGVVGQGNVKGQSGVAGFDVSKGGGNGVYGHSDHGVAVWCQNSDGIALHVAGKATFKNAGVVHVASGSKTVTVKVPGMTSSSIVLATIQKAQGTVSIAAAEAGSGEFTVTLTGKATSSLPVGWFVIG
ncbi:MAG TPA: hypothetical protein VMA95_12495 [Streptosporangiaceae bacterium]|nr:hypothetical protein [Streptosporangiaceae bacterium]